jgi:hypothetical protein
MSSLSALNTFSNWLRSRWAGLRPTFVNRPLTAACAVLLALLAALLVYRFWSPLRDFANRANDGQIVVNSPTVYTRQRLVNDRLEQTSWLQNQLKLADTVQGHDEFRIVDRVQSGIENRSTRLVVQSGESAGPAVLGGKTAPVSPEEGAGATAQDRAQATPLSDVFNIQPTTAALFRAKNAYREEVRSEMTQTQLDDRHDIRGNTIYRLAFDATIIAGSRTDEIAGIKVTSSHNPNAKQDQKNSDTNKNTSSWILRFIKSNDADERHEDRQTLARLYQEDYEELYVDWMRYTQTLVSGSLESVTRSFLSGRPEQTARMLFSRFLLGRICEFMTGRPPSDDRIDSGCDPQTPSEAQSTAQANRKRATELLAEYSNMRFGVLDDFWIMQTTETLRRFNQGVDPIQLRQVRGDVQSRCDGNKAISSVALVELGLQSKTDAANFDIPPYIGCPFDQTVESFHPVFFCMIRYSMLVTR